MLLNVVLWSIPIVLAPFALDLGLELTLAIVRGLAAIFKEAAARPIHDDRLASRPWS